MARPYERKTFLTQAPNELIRQYLATKELGQNIPWQHLREKATDPIERAIESAPDRTQDGIDGDFRKINDLADEGGVLVLIAEGKDHHHDGGLNLAPLATSAPSRMYFAFQIFLAHPEVFRAAHDLHSADSVSQTRWRKRADLPECKADTTKAGAARFGKRLSRYYMLRDGRGEHCHVDHWKRDRKLYWFAHPEDYGQAPLGYDEQHELTPQPQRPVFDLILQYCPAEGWLYLLAPGDKQTRQDLERLFGEEILRAKLPPQDTEPVTYELDAMMDRHFPFPTEVDDSVETVRVKRLRLRVIGTGRRTITLEADSLTDPKAVYGMLEDLLANSDLGAEALQLTGVGLQLVFRRNERGRQRKLTFDVGHPNACSLHDGDPLHEIAQKLLRRWGIDVSARAKTGPAPRRRSLQRGLDV